MMTFRAFLNTTTILRDGNYAAVFPIPTEDTREQEYTMIYAEFARLYDAEKAAEIITKLRTKDLSALELAQIRLQAAVTNRVADDIRMQIGVTQH